MYHSVQQGNLLAAIVLCNILQLNWVNAWPFWVRVVVVTLFGITAITGVVMVMIAEHRSTTR